MFLNLKKTENNIISLNTLLYMKILLVCSLFLILLYGCTQTTENISTNNTNKSNTTNQVKNTSFIQNITNTTTNKTNITIQNITISVSNKTNTTIQNTTNKTKLKQPTIFWDYQPLNPKKGKANLLVILWDPHRKDHPAPNKTAIENLIFGPDPSVKGYFLKNSQNQFILEKAAVLGWYDAKKNADHYWAASDTNDANGDGWISGHVEKWAEAIYFADKEFDYSKYDTNYDGNLEPSELGVLIIIPQNNPFGTNRVAYSQQYPNSKPLLVDGVKITWIAEAYIGNPPNMPLTAHELSHLFHGTPDMYFRFFQPYAAGAYSIMDQSHKGNSHLDPYNKLRLGWLKPRVVTEDGYYSLTSMDNSSDCLVIYDPKKGKDEFFLIENRQQGKWYDSWLPDYGLAIWHIIEDYSVYSKLPAPKDVDSEKWKTVGKHEWGRRGIRMLRPIYGPPYSNELWDGSQPETSSDVYLKWIDGSESGFVIRNISASSKTMSFWVDTPN